MTQLQVRITQKRSAVVVPSKLSVDFQPTGEIDVGVELLALNATKPESDLARKIAEKISFWLNKSDPISAP